MYCHFNEDLCHLKSHQHISMERQTTKALLKITFLWEQKNKVKKKTIVRLFQKTKQKLNAQNYTFRPIQFSSVVYAFSYSIFRWSWHYYFFFLFRKFIFFKYLNFVFFLEIWVICVCVPKYVKERNCFERKDQIKR